jgi:hypothetical protein
VVDKLTVKVSACERLHLRLAALLFGAIERCACKPNLAARVPFLSTADIWVGHGYGLLCTHGKRRRRSCSQLVLPEGASNVRLVSASGLDLGGGPELGKKFSYLDVAGRPVLVLRVDNLVEIMNMPFQVRGQWWAG